MINQLIETLTAKQQRQLIRLVGNRTELTSWLDNELSSCAIENMIWFGREQENQDVTRNNSNRYFDARLKQYQRHLGQESNIVIFDCYAGLNPDALGALSGTIKQGGVCILITPPDQEWLDYPDPDLQRICAEPYTISDAHNHYISRVISLLNNSKTVLTITDFNSVYTSLESYTANVETHQELTKHQHAVSQADAIKNIVNFSVKPTGISDSMHSGKEVAQQDGLILQADRGRGKSAALGIAAAKLLLKAHEQQTHYRIIISAPVSDSIQTALKHAVAELTTQGCDFEHSDNKISIFSTNNSDQTTTACLEFLAPDLLSAELPQADLVMIDEAAAIPMQLLKPVAQYYEKQVYSTTIHGYEGTGRGFEFKFKPLLRNTLNTIETLQLTQPIRWQLDDWLEQDINRLLGLDLTTSDFNDSCLNDLAFYDNENKDSASKESNFNFSYHSLDKAIDLGVFEQAFALLSNAHYRTKPNDLRYMLDAPNVELMTLRAGKNLVAAALVVTEGELDEELSEHIWQGRRRPRGNLFPQSLLAHSGFKQAGVFKYGRIVRIAVNPSVQQRGIGTLFLEQIESHLMNQGFDFICTSFGYWHKLFDFWSRNKFEPVRLGIKPEASTAEYSIFMCKTLSQNAKVQSFFAELVQRFSQTTATENYLEMPSAVRFVSDKSDEHATEVKTAEMKTAAKISAQYSEHDKSDLVAFAMHYRNLQSCVFAMVRFKKKYPQLLDALNTQDKSLLNDLLSPLSELAPASMSGDEAQAKEISQTITLVSKYQFSGEKQLVEKLRGVWQSLLARH